MAEPFLKSRRRHHFRVLKRQKLAKAASLISCRFREFFTFSGAADEATDAPIERQGGAGDVSRSSKSTSTLEGSGDDEGFNSVMDSLHHIDRMRNISGGSSPSGGESSSTQSGDDELFKRPKDGPVFCRKRKDRQSSGSSNASAFRPTARANKRERKGGGIGGGLRSGDGGEGIGGEDGPLANSVRAPGSGDVSANGVPVRRMPVGYRLMAPSSSSSTPAVLSSPARHRGLEVAPRHHSRSSAPSASFSNEAWSGKPPARPKLPKASKRGVTMKESETQTLSSGVPQPNEAASTTDLCVICLVKPKNYTIIHGSIGHTACCRKCAKRLVKRKDLCPVCRRPIQHVVKNVVV